jgi:PKD repeat protein
MFGRQRVFLCFAVILIVWAIFFEAKAELSKDYLSDISFGDFDPNKTINYTFAGNLAEKVASFPKETKADIIKDRVEKSIEFDKDTYTYSTAREVVQGCRNLPDISQVCEINDYLKKGDGKKKKWDYVNDPREVDTFQNASSSLKYGGDKSVGKGDCDDYAIVVSSLIECIGGASLIVFAEKEGKGAHMYSEVFLGNFGKDDDNIKNIIRWLAGKYKNSSNIVVDLDPKRKEYWLSMDWDHPYPGGQREKWSTCTPIRIRENAPKNPLELANIYPNPVINYDKNLLFAEEEIWFDATSSKDEDGNIIKYEWNFGDNTSNSSLINTTHIYEEPGKYNATLNISDNMGDYNITRILLSVGKPRIFDLAYKPKFPEPGDLVTFNATGMKVKKYYRWSFGDSESKEGPDLAVCTHSYYKAGSYLVNLSTIDDSYKFKNISSLVIVNEPPHAKFEWSPTVPNEKEKISFTGKDSYDTEGPIERYFWTFGDGTNATGKEVSHSYSYGGDYLVRLNVKDKVNSKNETQKIISINSPPIAYFSFNPPSPTTEDTINFDASLSSDPNSFSTIKGYEWDFGEKGDNEDKRGKFAKHRYQKEGNYTVKLTVIDDKNLKSTQSLLVEVRNRNIRNPPRAFLVYAPEKATTDDYMTFDATWSSDLDGYIKEYQWELSDGSKSNQGSFQHKFSREGEYTVNLTVTDDDNLSNNQSRKFSVGKPENLAAIISCKLDRAQAGSEVRFDALSSQGDIVGYQWDFGDKTPGKKEATVNHTYMPGNLKPIIYNVTLTVLDKKGSKNTTSRNFTVDPAKAELLVSDFTYQPEHPEAGKAITFNASTSKGSIRSYEWDYDDGSPLGSEKIENHTFPANASGTVTYEVTLTLTDINGEKHHKSKDVSVLPPPPPPLQPSFTFQPGNPTVGQEIVFDGSASQGTISNYLWDFGDGAPIRDEAIATHSFTASPYTARTYEVTLSVADKAGKKYPLTKKVTVKPPQFPNINALWIDNNNQKGQYLTCALYTQVRLIAYSTGGEAIMKEYYKPDPSQVPDHNYYLNYGENEIIFGADNLGEHILGYSINGQLSNIVVIYVVEQGQVEGSVSPPTGSYPLPNSNISSSLAQPYYLGKSSSSSQPAYPMQSFSSFPSHYPGQSSTSQSMYDQSESPYNPENWL